MPVLVDQLWPVLLAFARRGVVNDADAEDVAQEVFLRLCSRISEFDRQRDGVSWAFGIASYEVLTHRRRVQRRREVDVTVSVGADPRASQEDLLVEREIAVALRDTLGALSDDDRVALGVEQREDVEVVEVVAGATLRKRRQRALARLQSLWRQMHGGA